MCLGFSRLSCPSEFSQPPSIIISKAILSMRYSSIPVASTKDQLGKQKNFILSSSDRQIPNLSIARLHTSLRLSGGILFFFSIFPVLQAADILGLQDTSSQQLPPTSQSFLLVSLSLTEFAFATWQPTPILLLGKSHGQSSLVGYSL